MTLRLSIENVDRLPDGGPIRIEVKGRGLDLGRDSHLDWTLPDPGRSISGKHCEIRYRDGGYWLHDVSTNGTFVNGAEYRIDAPHLLRNGDRLNIGPYIIAVAVEEGRKLRTSASAAGASLDPGVANVWAPAGEAAAPEVAAKLAEHATDESLTSREVEVLRLIASGKANKLIASDLAITEETVKGHVKNILSKLAASDRTHAVTIALKRGIIDL